MSITIVKWDEGGYYMILDDGIGIARSKSLTQARRIAAALEGLVPTAPDPPDDDRPTYRDLVDLLRQFALADQRRAEELQVDAVKLVRRVDDTEPRP